MINNHHHSLMNKVFTSIFLLLIPFTIGLAQLASGDIAIIGFNFDNPDELGFVALVDIPSGTEIKFTDNGWYAAGGFRATEGIHTWTAATNIAAGSVVTVNVTGPLFSASGDQIIAYQGDDSSPSFIYALNSEGSAVWQADATSSNTSALPTGLVNGQTAIAHQEVDNGYYSGTTSGTKAELLLAISDRTNWTTNNSRIDDSNWPSAFTITGAGDSAPSVTSTTPNNSATDIAVDTNIDINFNEDVSVTGAWYSISGASSGAHTAVVSGGPSAFALNPDTDFTEGEVVTVTIYAAQVTDVDSDDPPDNMNTDYSFSFTILSPGTGWIINELLADPAADLTGDANGDGVRDSSDDEFVEIVNNTGGPVDISGWTIADGYSIRHTFPAGTVVPDQSAVVVFGGDTPTGTFGHAIVQTASTGSLGLNNSGDTVTLNNGTTDVAVYTYGSEGGDNQSLTRDPDITGTDPLVKHSTATGSGGALFSPGSMIDGSPFSGAVIPVPWVINEVHADPAADLTGDANGDGVRDSSDDEFVEIVNNTGGSVDISGWTIADGYSIRHTFPAGTVVPDQSAVVVFGGDTPTGTFGHAIVQTASTGALGLNNSGDTVTLNNGTTDVAVYTYGSEGGDNQSLTRDPDITGTDPLVKHSIATGSGGALFSPGTMIDGSPFPGAPTPPPVLEIYNLQGSGLASPYDGQTVTTEDNVVTAVGPEGFFIQTPTVSSDGDASTSDGLFVYTTVAPTVSVGDIVDVTGVIDEYYDFTEITSPTVAVTGTGVVPTAITFDGSTPSPSQPQSAIEYEKFEGMLVSITGGVVNGPNQYFGTDPIAEVYIVAGSDRVFRETGVEYPGVGGTVPTWDGNPEIFELDPDKLGLPNITINGGSTFDATGVLGYEYSGYELWPHTLTITEAALPGPVRDHTTDEFTVGALNLYRLFDTVNDGGEEVVTLAEYNRRLEKLSLYIRNVLKSPDILAVSEVEKLGALQDLADKITADDPSVNYTPYLEEGNDVSGIDVGFLVQSSRVQIDAITQLGKNETWIDPDVGGPALLHDRPPLLLEGSFIISQNIISPIAVMALHLRSLNGIETNRVQQKRLTQAQSIAGYIQGYQTADPNINLVVLGDLNAFEFTDGYVDVVGQIIGDFDPSHNVASGPDLVGPNLTNQVLNMAVNDRYSFNYQGSVQTLDHGLTSSHLTPTVTSMEFGRGNADAAVNFANIDGTPLRSSDHDGLVLYIDVSAATPTSVYISGYVRDGDDNVMEEVAVAFSNGGATVTTDENGRYISSFAYGWNGTSTATMSGWSFDPVSYTYTTVTTDLTDQDYTGTPVVYSASISGYVKDGANIGVEGVAVAFSNGGATVTTNATGHYSTSVAIGWNGTSTAAKDDWTFTPTSYTYSSVTTDQTNQNYVGTDLTLAVNDILESLPTEFALLPAYPNPFNPITTINYQLPEPSNVIITIYDIRGQRVRELISGNESAGYKSVIWNGRDDYGQMVSGGIYLYHLKAGNYNNSQKMILMK